MEKLAKWLLAIGLLILTGSTVIFFWNEGTLSTSAKINSEKFDHYGSFIGGIVGTVFSVASILLFYITLKEQRRDVEINQGAFLMQVDALKQQIKEFELQRQELEDTRKVLNEQMLTQKMQRFESTFFQLLHSQSEITKSMDYHDYAGKLMSTGRECFKKIFQGLEKSAKYAADKMENPREYNIIDSYLIVFDTFQSDLSHYFRHLYHIIKFVDGASLEVKTKKQYTNLVRAQLSSYELLLLYYNVQTVMGAKFRPLVEKYGLLKNLNKKMLLKPYKDNNNIASGAYN